MKKWYPTIFSIAVVLGLYYLSRPPQISNHLATQLSERFSFERHILPDINSGEARKIRQLHPSVDHFAAWLSFVGGAVSIGDLDGDDLSNDLIIVDPRYDTVTVCCVPQTGDRFDPFLIDLQRLPYEARSTAPMGTRIGDYNEDGRPDLLVYFWGRSPELLLQIPNSGVLSNESFDFVELVSPNQPWHTSCVTQADLDGDGHIDLVVGNYNPDGSKMLDHSDRSGVEVMMGSWARATNGGRSRVLLHSSSGSGPLFNVEEDAIPRDVAHGWAFACATADLDGDMLPELYFVHDWGADSLLHNRSSPGKVVFAELKGRRSFTAPRSMTIGLDTFNGMGIDFADINHDGYFDFLVSNITSDYFLHQSNLLQISTGKTEEMAAGIAPFTNQSEQYGMSRGGWTWDSKFADFDNDGEFELLQATGFFKGSTNRSPELHEVALANEELASRPEIYPILGVDDSAAGFEHNAFFVKHGEKYFDIADRLTQSGLSEPMLSRGIAIADVDRDGNLDFAYGNQWEESFFFKNTRKHQADFLALDLRLVASDLATIPQSGYLVLDASSQFHGVSFPAIGAKVKLSLRQEDQLQSRVAQVDGGNGHSGQRAPELHFGLGDNAAKSEINLELEWRSLSGKHCRATLNRVSTGWHKILLAETTDN